METTTEPRVPGLLTQAGISSDGKKMAIYLLNYNDNEKVVRLHQMDVNLTNRI